MRIYYKDIQRAGSLIDIKAWYEGESKELEKWLGVGYYNTIFIFKNNFVNLYYDKEECDINFEILRQKLTEGFFDNLCHGFFNLIDQSKNTESNEELFQIMIKCWPAWNIFDEISKYPEIASEEIIKRLIRVRKNTERFSYELSKRINKELEPEEYIFFQGQIIEKSFDEFIKENNIIIIT